MQQQTTGVVVIAWNFFGTLFLTNVLRVALPLVFLSSTAVSEITTAPSNKTARVGQHIELDCCSDESRPIDWFFIEDSQLNDNEYESICAPGASNQCIQITSGGVLIEGQNNRFNVSSNNSANESCSRLSFAVHNMSDAGAYRCYGGFESKANAFLTVIDLESNCSPYNATHFECGFFYSGRELKWTLDTTPKDSVTSCSEENKCTVICKTTFRVPGGNFSCQFGNYNGSEVDSASVKAVVTFCSTIESFNANIRCSDNSPDYISTMATVSNNDSGEDTNKSVVVVVSICAVVVLVIVIIGLLIKCDSKRSKSKTDGEITTQNLNEPVYSLVRRNEHDLTTPVCSEVGLNKKKSNKKMPVYAEVPKNVRKKPKTSAAQPGHVIAETGIYGYNLSESDANSKTTYTQNNSPHDCVIYSELQSLGPIADGTKKATPPLFKIREGFERSDYVSVDHTFKTPPAPPAPTRTHR